MGDYILIQFKTTDHLNATVEDGKAIFTTLHAILLDRQFYSDKGVYAFKDKDGDEYLINLNEIVHISVEYHHE